MGAEGGLVHLSGGEGASSAGDGVVVGEGGDDAGGGVFGEVESRRGFENVVVVVVLGVVVSLAGVVEVHGGPRAGEGVGVLV